MTGAFTAGAFLALFAHEEPAVYAADPGRVARVAIAAEQAQQPYLELWPQSDRSLGASVSAAIILESHLAESIHDGSKRGRAGEVCLVQINPINAMWKRVASTFDSLAGTGVEATVRCLRAGIETMQFGVRWCLKRHYKTNWIRAMWTFYRWGDRCWQSGAATERTKLTQRLLAAHWKPTKEMLAVLESERALLLPP